MWIGSGFSLKRLFNHKLYFSVMLSDMYINVHICLACILVFHFLF